MLAKYNLINLYHVLEDSSLEYVLINILRYVLSKVDPSEMSCPSIMNVNSSDEFPYLISPHCPNMCQFSFQSPRELGKPSQTFEIEFKGAFRYLRAP